MFLLCITKLFFLSFFSKSFLCILLNQKNRDVTKVAELQLQKIMRVSSPDNFRAPPPSPVASNRRASFTANEDVLSEFLDKCGRVPNLVLPDKVFPKHTFLVNPPTFDFLRLGSSLSALLDAISTIGCFQLINHGVPEAMVKAAMENTIFHDETAEFVLYKDMVDDHMTACYGYLRELMGEAERIGLAMREKLGGRRSQKEEEEDKDEGVRVCYVKKHNDKEKTKEEAIRMLIRGYDERHSLCLNFCCNAEFHVYSKRGWVSFSPRTDAVVVTVGDEGWNGKFKSVVGKPLLYKSNVNHHLISISFLYTTATPHNNTMGITEKKNNNKKKKKIISFSQQLYFALFLTLLFPFFLR